jgi:hypothetical protein
MWIGHGYVDILFDDLIERRFVYAFPRIWFEDNFDLIKNVVNKNKNYLLI